MNSYSQSLTMVLNVLLTIKLPWHITSRYFIAFWFFSFSHDDLGGYLLSRTTFRTAILDALTHPAIKFRVFFSMDLTFSDKKFLPESR